MDNKIPAVTMRNITKRFGTKVVANDKVWLDIYRGEILALLGENGSGKTTLMNMLSGIYFPDEGEIAIDGKEVVIRSPKDAFDLGIGMIHQHFKLVDVFTAAENIVLGLRGHGKLDLKAVGRKVSVNNYESRVCGVVETPSALMEESVADVWCPYSSNIQHDVWGMTWRQALLDVTFSVPAVGA